MISVLAEAAHHRAELACFGIAAVAIGALAVSRRLRWVRWAAVIALVGLGAWSARFRELGASVAVQDLPWYEWAGLAALTHASAARIGWVAALAASLVLAADGWRLRSGEIPGARVLLAAGGLLALSGIVAPQLGWVVLALIAVARGAEGGLAAALIAVAAIAGAEAHLYALAALVDPADVRWLDASAAARLGAWLGGALALGWGIWRIGWSTGLIPVAALGGLVGLEVGWARQSLAVGPADEVVEARSGLAEHLPTRVARVPGGCLVRPTASGWDGEGIGSDRIGALLERRGLSPCPPTVGPGSFAGAPVLALSGDTPTAALVGWHRSPVGEVVVLVRLDRGRSLPEWRISGVRIPVWEVPGSPLPGALLIRSREAVDEALAKLATAGVRADVLVHPDAAPTVAELLALCRAAEDRHPVGLRCVVAAGDPDRWAEALSGPSRPTVDPHAEWETVESDEDPF